MIIRTGDTLVVYTDGSWKTDKSQAHKNSGWSCVIVNETQLEIAYDYGFRKGATSTELEAILLALKVIPRAGNLIIRCDSKHIVHGLNKLNDIKTINVREGEVESDKTKLIKIIKNAYRRNVTFEYVKGHDIDQYNIIADALATKARLKAITRYPMLHVHKQQGIKYNPVTIKK